MGAGLGTERRAVLGLIGGLGAGSLNHITLVETLSWKWNQFWKKDDFRLNRRTDLGADLGANFGAVNWAPLPDHRRAECRDECRPEWRADRADLRAELPADTRADHGSDLRADLRADRRAALRGPLRAGQWFDWWIHR